MADGAFELVVLGIAQDGGLPHLGCDRDCCRSARASGRIASPACIGVVDHAGGRLLLVEATPRIEHQVALLQGTAGLADRGRKPVDAVLITHAHMGHYLGLAWFGREVTSTAGLPVHVSSRMADFLEANGPWSQLVGLGQVELRRFVQDEAFEPLPGLRVTAVGVPHREEYSDTVAFRIEGPRRCVLFVPDVDAWDRRPGLLEELIEGVDIAYLDGTFFDGRELEGRDISEVPHPPMVDTMRRLQERARRAPGSVRFIHLNHSNPALHDSGVRAAVERRGFRIAEEGERVGL